MAYPISFFLKYSFRTFIKFDVVLCAIKHSPKKYTSKHCKKIRKNFVIYFKIFIILILLMKFCKYIKSNCSLTCFNTVVSRVKRTTLIYFGVFDILCVWNFTSQMILKESVTKLIISYLELKRFDILALKWNLLK